MDVVRERSAGAVGQRIHFTADARRAEGRP
jgi:hypothetical protein